MGEWSGGEARPGGGEVGGGTRKAKGGTDNGAGDGGGGGMGAGAKTMTGGGCGAGSGGRRAGTGAEACAIGGTGSCVGHEVLGIESSSFRHCSTIGAVILHTGKSPGLRLQLVLLPIRADSTSCLLDL